MVLRLNTKTIAITIIFSALAIALIPFRIPAIFLRDFYYRFTEIPIVACFLLFGPKSGVSVALVSTLAQLTIFFDPTGFVAPLMGLWTILFMLLGVYVALRLLKQKTLPDEHHGIKSILYLTGFGTLFRMAISPFATYVLFSLLIPLTGGPSFSNAFIIAIIPVTTLFAITMSLFAITLGYLIARVVRKGISIGNLVQ